MVCPACKEDMLILEFRDVEIDFCARCHGVWLDEGELSQLARTGGDFWHMPPGGRKTKRRCPRCNRRMALATFPGTGIEVDVCGRGHGIWFDGGELEGVLREGGASEAADLLKDFLGQILTGKQAEDSASVAREGGAR